MLRYFYGKRFFFMESDFSDFLIILAISTYYIVNFLIFQIYLKYVEFSCRNFDLNLCRILFFNVAD